MQNKIEDVLVKLNPPGLAFIAEKKNFRTTYEAAWIRIPCLRLMAQMIYTFFSSVIHVLTNL